MSIIIFFWFFCPSRTWYKVVHANLFSPRRAPSSMSFRYESIRRKSAFITSQPSLADGASSSAWNAHGRSAPWTRICQRGAKLHVAYFCKTARNNCWSKKEYMEKCLNFFANYFCQRSISSSVLPNQSAQGWQFPCLSLSTQKGCVAYLLLVCIIHIRVTRNFFNANLNAIPRTSIPPSPIDSHIARKFDSAPLTLTP